MLSRWLMEPREIARGFWSCPSQQRARRDDVSPAHRSTVPTVTECSRMPLVRPGMTSKQVAWIVVATMIVGCSADVVAAGSAPPNSFRSGDRLQALVVGDDVGARRLYDWFDAEPKRFARSRSCRMAHGVVYQEHRGRRTPRRCFASMTVVRQPPKLTSLKL